MKQRVADCIAVVSIALLILVLSDWHRSYHHGDVILLMGPAGEPIIITSGRGLLYVAVANVPVVDSQPWSCELRWVSADEVEDRFEAAAAASAFHFGYHVVPLTPPTMSGALTATERNAFGFSLIAGKSMFGVPGTFYALASVPFWAIVLPPGYVSFRCSKRKLQSWTRVRQGRCCNCGYDLRASPQRCPECGTAAPPAKSAESKE